MALALLLTSPGMLGVSLPGAHAITAHIEKHDCPTLPVWRVPCSPRRGHLAQPRTLRPETPPCKPFRADPRRRLAVVQNSLLL